MGTKKTKKQFIVRSYAAGVFAGEIVSKTHEKSGLVVKMANARRIWYWKGAASLSQLSIDGVSCPSECKFPEAVPEVELMNVVEILPMSEKAVASVAGVPVWRA